ncbi:esterase, PHB depolymerase family [Colwellia chukchiensis]|uniref:Esterase, PHB depolymerase family n=1 Tax=Colwellia chukchiensis TaxID=641665 RepID=A0A1H7RXA0_9GAMM|nr:PHB depolymerase family esterase [Colwellia chukchiensis]SEL64852.1 esterase, PHB depolymerase family [Colwellia chukchiensis]
MYKYLATLVVITSALFSVKGYAQFTALTEFGDNPGELSASYLPASDSNDNLLVLLHGCVQQGQALAQQSGLLSLAKNKGFALLIPQQSSTNNIKGCFNWFSTQDIEKNQGESLSIKNMITTLNAQQNFKNIYIIGLSAGGAMASSMLVHYPELFSAGAIIAGIPYPCADNLITAIACMRSGPSQEPTQLTALVKTMQPAVKQWPRLSIWTGLQDKVVNPKNAQHLALHWAQLTQASTLPTVTQHAGYKVSQWQDQNHAITVELIEVLDMDHGIAIAPALGDGSSAAPFVINSAISTSLHLLNHWQL